MDMTSKNKEKKTPQIISISLHRMAPEVRAKLYSLAGFGERSRYINQLVLADLQVARTGAGKKDDEQTDRVNRAEVEQIVRRVLRAEGYDVSLQQQKKARGKQEQSADSETINKVLDSIDQLIVR